MARRFTYNAVSSLDELDELFVGLRPGIKHRVRCANCETDTRRTHESARRWFLEHGGCGSSPSTPAPRPIGRRLGEDRLAVLADAAWQLVHDGELDPDEAILFITSPTPRIIDALEQVAA